MAPDRGTNPDPESPRLFVGVPIPASVTPAIDGVIDPWRQRFPKARWVPAHERHVTMKYLGPTPERLDAWVRDRVRTVAASSHPFELRLAGSGAFPSNRLAHVLWVGLEDEAGHLTRAVGMLEAGLGPEFTPERRAFTPHITVARSQQGLAVPSANTASSLTSDPFSVREIVLYRSHRGRPGSRYEALESFRLGS